MVLFACSSRTLRALRASVGALTSTSRALCGISGDRSMIANDVRSGLDAAYNAALARASVTAWKCCKENHRSVDARYLKIEGLSARANRRRAHVEEQLAALRSRVRYATVPRAHTQPYELPIQGLISYSPLFPESVPCHHAACAEMAHYDLARDRRVEKQILFVPYRCPKDHCFVQAFGLPERSHP